MPQSAFGRTLALLLSVSACIVLGTVLLGGAYRAQSWAELCAELAVARLRLITPVIATLGTADAARFIAEEYAGTGLVLMPEPGPGPSAPVAQRLIARRLGTTLAGSGELSVRHGNPAMLWLRAPGTGGHWLGMPLPARSGRALLGIVSWLIVILLIAQVAALRFARQLTAPLRRLADLAPALVRGTVPLDYRPAGPTEVRRLGESLLAAAHESQRLREERELWLAGISHDLRTPLARLRLSAELLPESLDLRSGIIEDIGEMDVMLGQFLDYLRLGREEATAPTDLAALLHHTLARLPEPGMVAITGSLCAEVRPQAMARAVTNLVLNARRHGSPPVRITLDRQENRACIAVHDGGAGFAPERLQTLAEPFTQGDDARSRGGSGLGLAIAARVAALHGGGLQSERTPEGFTMRLCWPLCGPAGVPRSRC